MAINPIQGASVLNVGSVSTYTDTTPGGVWTTTNGAVATVDVNGNVTAVAPGFVQVVYTLAGNSTALNLTIQAQFGLTSGFNFNYVYPALQNRVLWQSQGAISDSGQYFEDFHELNNTEIITALANLSGSSLTTFLANKQRAVIMQVVNSIYTEPTLIDEPKLVFWRGDIPSLPFQNAQNQNQFVGLRIFVGKGDHAIKVNSLIAIFTYATSINLYLYNDFFINPIMTIPIVCNAGEETIIDFGETLILNNMVPQAYKSGMWYLGYYQPDMVNPALGNNPNNIAIYYPGEYGRFKPCKIMSFASQMTTDINNNRNFVRNNIGANNLMYGLNMEVSTFKDGSNRIVQNKSLFDEPIGLIWTAKVLEMCVSSYQSGSIQRTIMASWPVSKLNTELNGDPGNWQEGKPKIPGLYDRIKKSLVQLKSSFQKTTLTQI